eukprot:1100208-Amphidinium_carterae.1
MVMPKHVLLLQMLHCRRPRVLQQDVVRDSGYKLGFLPLRARFGGHSHVDLCACGNVGSSFSCLPQLSRAAALLWPLNRQAWS